jgi:hypothetical protein
VTLRQLTPLAKHRVSDLSRSVAYRIG